MKKTLRKISIIALAAVMVFGMSATAFAGTLTMKQAVNKALKDAKVTKNQVRITDQERDYSGYEIEFIKKKDRTEYSYEISKRGRILEKNVEYRYKHNYSKKKIGKLSAQKKVAKFSGISLKRIKRGWCYYERDDGQGKYTVEFESGAYWFEYELLAPTGKVIEYTKSYY